MSMVKAGRSWVPPRSGSLILERSVADLLALGLNLQRARNQSRHLYLGRFVFADERLRLPGEGAEVVVRECMG